MNLRKRLENGLKKIGSFMDRLDEVDLILIFMAIIGAYWFGLGMFIIIGG